MEYRIEYTSRFFKELGNIDKKEQRRILSAIDKLSSGLKSADIKKLKGEDIWRMRIGNYRILFEIVPETYRISILLMLNVKHRKDVYRDL